MYLKVFYLWNIYSNLEKRNYMFGQRQQTIEQTISTSGVGLHSGRSSKVSLSPAPVDNGIVFRRKVNSHVETCQASIRNLRSTELCTVVGSNGFQIQTTEHVLSALWGLGIDNAFIDIDSEEVPAMDGSAAPFAKLIRLAGILPQERPKTYLKIVEPIHIGDGNRGISILPAPFSKITYTIDYDHELIQQQTYEHAWSTVDFEANIAHARTFAFSHEVEALWARGLGQGGSLDNTIVFSDDGIMNEEDLRFPDECVRHKVLDLIGDLSLLGIHVIGHIVANCSGHQLHTRLVQAILDNPEAWTLAGPPEKHVSELADLIGQDAIQTVPLPANAAF